MYLYQLVVLPYWIEFFRLTLNCPCNSYSLFAFPVPQLVPLDYVPGDKLELPEALGQRTAIKKERNLIPGRSKMERFVRHFASVLSCKHILKSCNPGGARQNACLYRLTRTLFFIFAWNSYFVQLCFPVLTVVAAILVLSEEGYCYLHLGSCILLKYDDSGEVDL